MTKLNRVLIITGAVLLTVITVLENGLFRKEGNIHWKPDLELMPGHFTGYINLLSDYGGVIASNIEYEIGGSTYDSVSIHALMYPEYSWLRRSLRNSEEALRHEHYHFHITEVFARKFRMLLRNMDSQDFDKKVLRKQYRGMIAALDVMQEKYDDDCDHGLLRERQKDWEYMVDSMMTALNYYSVDQPEWGECSNKDACCFRKLDFDAYYRIRGRYGITDSIARHAPHYRFQYTDGRITRVEYFDDGERVNNTFNNVAVIEIEYEGNTEFRTYFDAAGRPMKNDRGAYGTKILRRDGALVVTSLDRNRTPMENVDGFSSIIYDPDYRGRNATGVYLNLEGSQVTTKDGYCVSTRRYDHNDNVVEHANYNNDNQLINNADGIAITLYAYDEMNNLVRVSYCDSDHRLTEDQYGVASYHVTFDRNGFILMEYFRDKEDRVMMDQEGNVYYYRSYDNYGNLTDVRFYGTNKNLIIDENGFGRLRHIYDEHSRLAGSGNYDAYDQLYNDSESFCKRVFRYDDRDRVIEKDVYAVDSTESVQFSKTVRFSYTEHDRIAFETYHDQVGDLLPDPSGICKKAYTYDEAGNLVETRHFNQDGQLQPAFAEVVTIRYRYTNGLVTGTEYVDRNGRLAENEEGIAREVNKYDDRQLRTETRYYNADQQPTTFDKNAEIIRWTYNQAGHITGEQYFNAEGHPKAAVDGIAKIQYTRDSDGQVLTIHYFNEKLELVGGEHGGVAIMEYTYDKDGLVSRLSYKDREVRLVNTPAGHAIENRYYDAYGRIKFKEYLTRFKQPVVIDEGYASIECMYDRNGNIIAEILRDASNALVADEEGYAIYNYSYDRNGEITQTTAYGADPAHLGSISKGDFSTSATISSGYYGHITNLSGRNGMQSTYYDNGQKQSEGFYLNGKLQGSYMTWYENGTISSVIQYVNGRREGPTVEYYQNGEKWREVRYENNSMLERTMVTWHMNGALRSKYINGQEVYWDEHGKKVQTG